MVHNRCWRYDTSEKVLQYCVGKRWLHIRLACKHNGCIVTRLFVEVAKRGCQVLPKRRSCSGRCLGMCSRGGLVQGCHDNL